MPCHTDDALVCSRSIVRDLLHQRYFPSDSCWTFKTCPKCSTSGEWDPYPATQAAKASFTAFLHHFQSQATKRTRRRMHAVNDRTSFSSAKVVTLRESPLSLANNTKTWAPRQCQRRAICPQKPNIERRRCWSILEAGFLSPIPSPYAKRPENGGSALDAPRFAGRKSGRWSSSPRHGAFSNRSCAHRFAPKWSALTAPRQRTQSVTRLPEQHGLARYATIRSLNSKVEWTSHAYAMHEPRPWSIAKTCSHAVSAHAVEFETKLETSRGVHWQRWTPPVYAPATWADARIPSVSPLAFVPRSRRKSLQFHLLNLSRATSETVLH